MTRARLTALLTAGVLPAASLAAAVLSLGLAGAPAGEARAEPPAGEVHLEATADRNAITLGDPVTVTVRLIYPKGTRVVSFEPAEALGAFGLLGQKAEPPREVDLGRIEERRTLRVTAYELGRKEIPAFLATYADASGREGTVKSAPIAFDVASVLAGGEGEPADIKRPAAMPTAPVWPWLALGLLAAAAAGWILWCRFRARPAEAVAALEAAPRPAHEVAYAELERLLKSGLLEKGLVKEFHIELSEIIRRYLAVRYGIETLDRTTAEILDALRAARVPVRVHAGLGEFFLACDLVKFAKHRPAAEETRVTVERAYRLVDETRAAPAPAPAAPAAAAAGAVAP